MKVPNIESLIQRGKCGSSQFTNALYMCENILKTVRSVLLNLVII